MPLCLTSIDFPAHPRRQLRACLEEQRIASGSQMPAAAVDEAVDLACHAAESARRTMFEILDRASDPRITTTSIGLAISLLSSDCARIEAGLRDYAEQTGATFREARVEIS
tara:strand:- start:2546 stop:2878 length:333 start_codon:yes stop_codon:yes gene_type:complete